jgi:hypothetical protein
MNPPIKISFEQSKNIREFVLLQFFSAIGPLHEKLYKRRPNWGWSTAKLLEMPKDSLGNSIGLFLQKDNLEPIPKAERHDVFHVLLQYGTAVNHEAGMQFCIFGAGKKSLSVLATIFLSLIFLPEHWKYFYKQYKLGRQYWKFYNLPFQYLLNCNINYLRSTILKK